LSLQTFVSYRSCSDLYCLSFVRFQNSRLLQLPYLSHFLIHSAFPWLLVKSQHKDCTWRALSCCRVTVTITDSVPNPIFTSASFRSHRYPKAYHFLKGCFTFGLQPHLYKSYIMSEINTTETRPRAKSVLSYESKRSRRSSGSGHKLDLTETHKDKKRLHTKADPSMAMNEAQPCEFFVQ
jgi:hypothetical protein